MTKRGNGFIDLKGERFSRLTVLEHLGSVRVGKEGQRKSLWRCRCDCGTETTVIAQGLRKGTTRSCGCLQQEVRSAAHKTHGMRETPEYDTWCRMKRRCTVKANNNRWAQYGGRGIKVCAEWMESFETFFAHIGPRPTPAHSIDRYPNNDGHYEPGNVRWATRSEQMLNRGKWKKNKLVTHCRHGHAY